MLSAAFRKLKPARLFGPYTPVTTLHSSRKRVRAVRISRLNSRCSSNVSGVEVSGRIPIHHTSLMLEERFRMRVGELLQSQ